jgi:hypothetical protein
MKNNTCSYAIGIVNTVTGIMTVLPTSSAYIMKPVIDQHIQVTTDPNLTNKERRSALTEEFGSKKKKRSVLAVQSNSISSENIQGGLALEAVMSSSKYQDKDSITNDMNAADKALQTNRASLLPYHNINADDLKDAYPIEKLVPSSVLESLQELFNSIILENNNDGDNNTNSIFTSFESRLKQQSVSSSVLSLLSKIKHKSDKKSKQEKVFRVMRNDIPPALMLHFSIRFFESLNNFSQSISKDDLIKTLGIIIIIIIITNIIINIIININIIIII